MNILTMFSDVMNILTYNISDVMNILTFNMFRFNKHFDTHVQTLYSLIWYNWATHVLVLYIVHLSLQWTLNFVGVVEEVVSMTTRELLYALLL